MGNQNTINSILDDFEVEYDNYKNDELLQNFPCLQISTFDEPPTSNIERRSIDYPVYQDQDQHFDAPGYYDQKRISNNKDTTAVGYGKLAYNVHPDDYFGHQIGQQPAFFNQQVPQFGPPADESHAFETRPANSAGWGYPIHGLLQHHPAIYDSIRGPYVPLDPEARESNNQETLKMVESLEDRINQVNQGYEHPDMPMSNQDIYPSTITHYQGPVSHNSFDQTSSLVESSDGHRRLPWPGNDVLFQPGNHRLASQYYMPYNQSEPNTSQPVGYALTDQDAEGEDCSDDDAATVSTQIAQFSSSSSTLQRRGIHGPHLCGINGCPKLYKNKKGLKRHKDTHYAEEIYEAECLYPGCNVKKHGADKRRARAQIRIHQRCIHIAMDHPVPEGDSFRLRPLPKVSASSHKS
ncbi:hypothetical protein ABW20_dc0109520 [Dactylellina cionopaga]|nr:hypothetical protein ABW20_dc0109520 [Dactylellina cionopaga]